MAAKKIDYKAKFLLEKASHAKTMAALLSETARHGLTQKERNDLRLEVSALKKKLPFEPFDVVCIDDSPNKVTGRAGFLVKGKLYRATGVRARLFE